jgi:tRNA(fMet)-specific endonuclease VapC
MTFLDTNTVIAVLEGRPMCVGEKVAAHLDAGAPVAISSIVVFEMWFGVEKSQRREANARRLAAFLATPIDVVAFDAEDARSAGTIRHHLAAAGTPIGAYDVLIAGQALRHSATLVTANVREFSRVPGLRVEDWSVD